VLEYYPLANDVGLQIDDVPVGLGEMANHGSKYTDRKLIPVAKNQNPSSEGPDRRGLETGGRDLPQRTGSVMTN